MAVQPVVRSPAAFGQRQLVAVVALALALRLLFLALTAGTYDYDEFVLLLLGRDTAHGAVPYHDFLFFHPPGALVLLRLVEPLTSLWWPIARLIDALVDTVTAAVVWRIGTQVFGQRAGLAAGLLYACSPLALISAVRVGQDPLMTALGMLGLLLLLSRGSWLGAAGAGVCLGLAVWVKYPAVYFLPVYVLAAPRRSPIVLPVAAGTLAACLLPFHAEWGALVQQTITFQDTRWLMAAGQRWQTTALFWLGANLPAVAALPFVSVPLWLLAGFGLGGLFILSSQVYYHYFVPVVPFAALLASPYVARIGSRVAPTILSAGLIITVAWGLVIQRGGASPLYVTAAHLGDVAPTVQLLQRRTPPNSVVLSDRFEYPYLAHRQVLAHYFWNVGVLVDAHYLERRLAAAGAVVLSRGASSGYPYGLAVYLDARYSRLNTGATVVWRLPGAAPVIPAGD